MRKNSILLLALLVISLCGFLFTTIARNSMINFNSAFTSQDLGLSKPSLQLVDNVYLIIIDGLPYDQVQSGHMPYLQELIKNRQATLTRVNKNVPPYSKPALLTLISGATSELNGFITDEQKKIMTIPDIFALASKRRQKTAASTDIESASVLKKIVSPPEQLANFDIPPNDSLIYDRAMKIYTNYQPNLMLVQTSDVQIAAQKYGTKSPEYRQAVKNTDNLFRQFYTHISAKENSLFIVTSDYGSIPLILLGKGVKPDHPEIEISSSDIAPTISAALGLPFTPYMQGRIISELFNFNEKSIMEKKYLLWDEKKEFIKTFAHQTGTIPVLSGSDPDNSFLYMDAYVRDTTAQKLKAGYFTRLFITHLIFFSTLLIYFRFFRPGRGFIIYYKVPALIYFIGFNLLYFAQGFAYSIYKLPTLWELIIRVGLSTILAFLLAILAHKIISQKFAFQSADINPILHLSISILFGLLWITLYTYSQIGIKINMFLPNMDLFVLHLVTTFEITVVALVALFIGVFTQIKWTGQK